MNGLPRSSVLSLLFSVALGFSCYGLVLLLLLPVTNATDGQGHGPDRDTQEWQRAVADRTRSSQTLAGNLGFSVGALSLPILFRLIHRHQHQ